VAELTAFLRGLFKKWQALILGGVVAVGLTMWQWFGSPPSRIWYGVLLLFTFLPAMYLTWRDEYRRANEAVSEVAELRNAARRASEQNKPAIWRPAAALQSHEDGAELKNELVLRDAKLFELVSVALLSPEGARLAEIQADAGSISTGFRVHITHADILKLWNRHYHSGSIQYSVRRGDAPYTGNIPFVAEEAMIKNTIWIRLIG